MILGGHLQLGIFYSSMIIFYCLIWCFHMWLDGVKGILFRLQHPEMEKHRPTHMLGACILDAQVVVLYMYIMYSIHMCIYINVYVYIHIYTYIYLYIHIYI